MIKWGPWVGLCLPSPPLGPMREGYFCPSPALQGPLNALPQALTQLFRGSGAAHLSTVFPETLILSPLWPADQGWALTEAKGQLTQW